MATYTSNYGLHQWEPEDKFMRTDFNEDLEKIDEGLGGLRDKAERLDSEKVGAVIGTYTGNNVNRREINLGTQPAAVMIEYVSGGRNTTSVLGGMALPGHVCRYPTVSSPAIEISEQGFIVTTEQYSYVNASGYIYYYIAFFQ